MPDVWEEVYEALYRSNAFFFISMAGIFAASVFHWRYKRRKKQGALLLVICSYGLAFLSYLVMLLGHLILHGDFTLFIWGIGLAYVLYRIMFW